MTNTPNTPVPLAVAASRLLTHIGDKLTLAAAGAAIRARRLLFHPQQVRISNAGVAFEAAEDFVNRDDSIPETSLDGSTDTPAPPFSKTASSVNPHVELHLAGDLVFHRRVSLPLVAVGHVKSALGIQMNSLVPLPPETLEIVHRVRSVDTIRKLIWIDLFAVKKSDLDRILRTLAHWNFRVHSVEIEGSTDLAPAFVRFPKFRPSTHSSLASLHRVLKYSAVAILVLSIFHVGLQYWRVQQAVAQAEHQLQPRIEHAMTIRQSYALEVKQLDTLRRLQQQPSSGEILSDLTSRLPSDAWLSLLSLRGSRLLLVGTAKEIQEVVSALKSSPLLDNIAVRSATSSAIGGEQFEIAAVVRGRSHE